MRPSLSYDVTQHMLVVNRRFGTPYHSHIRGSRKNGDLFMERYELNPKIHVIQVDASVSRISEGRVPLCSSMGSL